MLLYKGTEGRKMQKYKGKKGMKKAGQKNL